jgi:rod shape-determining protein MreD
MLIFASLLALFALLLQEAGLPAIPLNVFTPWLALITLFYPLQKDFWKPLVLAAISGVFLDLLSDHPIGVYACSYTLTSALLFRYRNHFLYNQPLHLSFCTLITSLSSYLLQTFFLFLFDRRMAIPGIWIFANGIGGALFDGLYALIWFSAPFFLYAKISRIWVLYCLKKKHFPT